MPFTFKKTKQAIRRSETQRTQVRLKALHTVDIFGQDVQFNIDGHNKEIKTIFGGFVSLIFGAIIGLYIW